MSQLSFAEFFNTSGAEVVTPPTIHKMMSADIARKQFVSVFAHTGRHLRRWDVFSDFITLAANELDMARIRTPENIESCRKICARYDAEDIKNLHTLFNLMVCALDAKFHDFLGSIFMELELGSGDMGQYFTPYCVQSMMARMLIPGIKDVIEKEGFATLAECLLEAGFNPSSQLFVSCIDIDAIAADMAFIQLSLLGIAAEVVTGNTLTLQLNKVRYTPVYYINSWGERLESQRRIKAMLNFIRREAA